ncbi:MAG: hypothetical protein PHR56_02870 [Dehalococcoidales bacterium]|nr:hypothetical protein [Dehalococcoidales bacterium]
MRTKVRELKALRHELEYQTDSCHHFWKIEEAQGHVSVGTCKICGTTKEFLNSMPEYSPFGDVAGTKAHGSVAKRDQNEKN